MLRVALTGGIGSGKSTVAKLFAAHDVTIIDADQIARELTTASSPLTEYIIQHFGKIVLTQQYTLDRSKLRQIIFNDADEKRWLEALLHPEIRKIMQQQITKVTSPYCILVIPLLTQAKEAIDYIDRICVVDSNEALQIKRTCQRDHINPEQAQRILKQQISPQQRLALADDIIDNNTDLDSLNQQVNHLNNYYLQLENQRGQVSSRIKKSAK